MSKAHTPTPWKKVGPHIFDEHGRIFICTPDGVTHDEATANRALIVRAVNSHESMVEALEKMLQDVDNGTVMGVEPKSLHETIFHYDTVAAARAALKLAKADQ